MLLLALNQSPCIGQADKEHQTAIAAAHRIWELSDVNKLRQSDSLVEPRTAEGDRRSSVQECILALISDTEYGIWDFGVHLKTKPYKLRLSRSVVEAF